MIEIRSLSKKFGAFTAVDNVSFKVARGEVLGFLGPNGAGKSTTMKMLTGFLAPTSGTAIVCGHDVLQEPLAVKEQIGYLPEGAPAYPDMTPDSFLRFVASIRGLSSRAAAARISELIATVHLEGVMQQPIETLSKGYKRRVGLAAALMHDPEVLIMDEPTDGLDPNQKHEVRELIRSMASRKAIVLSTHILEEVEAVCTRAIIINRGRIVADGTPADLQTRSRFHNAVRLSLRQPAGVSAESIRAELARLRYVDGVDAAAAHNGTLSYTLLPRPGKSIMSEVAACVRSKGWEVDELRVETGRLDEVFRTITSAKGGAQ
jgi:ABC-2 type transport system ATP-binding protein